MAVPVSQRAKRAVERITSLSWQVRRITRRNARTVPLEVVVEEPLAVEVNGRLVATMMYTPGAEEELAVGFCITERIISDFSAIRLVELCSDHDPEMPGPRNLVTIWADSAALSERGGNSAARLIRSGCGVVDAQEELNLDLPRAEAAWTIAAGSLFKLAEALQAGQDTYRRTQGVHGASLFNREGEEIVTREDIGRHNAVDKVIGHCLLRNICPDDKLLIVTGRASHEMVGKALWAGIPILASFSSPTSLAVRLAEQFNLTLVGYLRGGAMNVYTHPWRLEISC
jgi:FdhD protein